MFSFLDKKGVMTLRLSREVGQVFLSGYDSGPVVQFGSVMRGYVAIPDDLLRSPRAITPWIKKASERVETLDPK